MLEYWYMLAKPTKLSKAKLRTKADRLASQFYRTKTPYCELQGLDSISCGGNIQWCHVYSRSHLHIRYESFNNLILCQGHHRFYTTNPIEWVRTLEKHYPERLALAEQNRYKIHDKIDYDYWIDLFTVQSN